MIRRHAILAIQLGILIVGKVSAETVQIEDGPRIDGSVQFKGDKLRITTQTGEGEFALSRIESILPTAASGTESCKSLELMVRALRYREIHPEDPQGSDHLIQAAYNLDPTNLWIMCGYAWGMLDRFDVSGARAFLTEHELKLRSIPEEYLALQRELKVCDRYVVLPSDLGRRVRLLDSEMPKRHQSNRVWCHGVYKVVDVDGNAVPLSEYNLNGGMEDQTIEEMSNGWVLISGKIHEYHSPPIYQLTTRAFPLTLDQLQVFTGTNECKINETIVFRRADPGLIMEVGGKVCDSRGEPLRGANVSWSHQPSGLQTNALSGLDGTYQVMLVPGRYSLQVSANGFPSHTSNVIVEAGVASAVPVVSLDSPDQAIKASFRVCVNLAGGTRFDSATNVFWSDVDYPVEGNRSSESFNPLWAIVRRLVIQEKGRLLLRSQTYEWVKDMGELDVDTLNVLDGDQFFALDSASKENPSEIKIPLVEGHAYIGSVSPMSHVSQSQPRVTIKLEVKYTGDISTMAPAAR